MASKDSVLIARVDELEAVCPGNALVWEFVQLKGLERSELMTRIQIMFDRQCECTCNPNYVEQIHRDGYNVVYRRKIIELYLEVEILGPTHLCIIDLTLFVSLA
jgi:hypothetical protein